MALDNTQRIALLAERAAVLVTDDMVVGLGTGSTAAALIDALGARVRDGLRIAAVQTSASSLQHASDVGIQLVHLNDIDRLDICTDGADEIDPDLWVVKGRGGALLYEKLVARRAERYVIIASAEKLVDRLGTRMPLPVEVVPEGWSHTAEEVAALQLVPTLRRARTGEPFRTDGGHFILDCTWPGDAIIDAAALAQAVKLVTGVVDHGLFIDMVDFALTIDENGEITEHRR